MKELLNGAGISEYESFVRQRYSNISDEILDGIVEGLMREFPNCGYKRMNGLLLDAGHRIQPNCIRECMRRVNPDGVLLRALELRTVRRRRYQVSGPLALWHIDGNHKLIRYIEFSFTAKELCTYECYACGVGGGRCIDMDYILYLIYFLVPTLGHLLANFRQSKEITKHDSISPE